MGTWIYIRGWLQFPHGLGAEAKRIIRAGDTTGWTFPEGGWLDAACYARAVRDESDVLEPIREIATLPAVDDDSDRATGLFLVFHETEGHLEWQIRDGDVFINPAPTRYDYLWQ
jgi:hypothetical protein